MLTEAGDDVALAASMLLRAQVAERQRDAVVRLALLAGVDPGVLAAEAGMSEAEVRAVWGA